MKVNPETTGTETAPRLQQEESGQPRIQITNPATGKPVGSVPIMGEFEVRRAVEKARAAQPAWGALPARERSRRLLDFNRAILDNMDHVLETIRSETGKPGFDALAADVLQVLELNAHYAKAAPKHLKPHKVSSGKLLTKSSWIAYHPWGVIGIISPWNFPLNLSAGPVLTALHAGNAVVLKPSEVTPFSGLLVGELAEKAGLPKDLVQVVTGDGSTGAALTRAGVDKLFFTGSVNTGRKIAAACAESLTPYVLELGGKDPAVVLKDCDLERTANGLVLGAFFNTGQVCQSTERVYVEAPVFDDLLDRVVSKTKELRQGWSDDGEGYEVSSMIMPRQADIVEAHLKDAVEKGAKILCGGQRNGNFIEPTVLTDVTDEMDIMRHETFGPVLPIVKVDSEAEAMRRANDSHYGLSGSIYTSKDRERGMQLAQQMQAGAISLNDVMATYSNTALPFGGMKESGQGRSHGEEGLKEFVRSQAIAVEKVGAKREVFWYPYHRNMLAIGKQMMHVLYGRGIVNRTRALFGAFRKILSG